MLAGSGIRTVPLVAEGVVSRDQFLGFLETQSQFREGKVEGTRRPPTPAASPVHSLMSRDLVV